MIEEKGHETYAVTLTGMGERSHLASREFGIETAVQDAINLIEYEDLNDIILLGKLRRQDSRSRGRPHSQESEHYSLS